MPEDRGSALVDALPRLRRYAIAVCRDADTADELVQGACERALAAPARSDDAPFLAWMFTILRNLWFDRLRRKQTEGVTMDIDDMAELPGAAGEEDRVDTRRTLERVQRAIDRLPDAQRELMLLVCVEELSYKEAAAVTGVPIGTVMSRLARARLRVAQLAGLDAGSAPTEAHP